MLQFIIVQTGVESRYSDAEAVRNIVSLPPNPYTSDTRDTPTRDSHYYLTANVAKYTRVCFSVQRVYTVFTANQLHINQN